MQVTDQLNRTIILNKTPTRIVCLVPSLTELLCDLSLKDLIVGVTKFCVHPANIRNEKTVVGGTKNVRIELIKELEPDLIIANKEENTEKTVENLMCVAPIHVSDINTIQDCQDLIGSYGEIFSVEEEAKALNLEITERLSAFTNQVLAFKKSSVAYFIWKDPWMVVARDTYINHILGVNKFENYFLDKVRYPEIELGMIEGNKLDFIFLSSEPYPFSEKHIKELQELFPHTKVILVDGEMFSWFGSRIPKALDYFEELNKRIR